MGSLGGMSKLLSTCELSKKYAKNDKMILNCDFAKKHAKNNKMLLTCELQKRCSEFYA